MRDVWDSTASSRLLKKGDDTRVFESNPTNAVGGAFILRLRRILAAVPNPTNAVGGSFIFNLAFYPSESESERRVRLGVNLPPTALVGFESNAAFSLVDKV